MGKALLASRRLQDVIPLLIIFFCGVIAYSNTFDASFQFDDYPNIQVNPLIQNTEFLVAPSRYCSYVGPQSMDYITCAFFKRRYVGYLSFAANYLMDGFRVQGYHAVNLAIHVINGMLVYSLCMLCFRTPFLRNTSYGKYAPAGALFTSLLFVAHPVQTQAITYIVQRFTSLATLFYLLSVTSYLGSRISGPHRSRILFYFLSLISALLAMKTKEIAFTLPLVIALCEFGFFEADTKTRFLYVGPMLLTMLVIPLSIVTMGKPLQQLMNEVSFASRLGTDMPRWDYLMTQFPVVVTYIRLLFLPVRQNLDYDFTVYHSFFTPQVSISFFFLASLAGLGIYLWYRSKGGDALLRMISLGLIWFFVTLTVESGLVPILDVIFEHRVYLPSVGAFLAIASSLILVAGKLQTRWRPSGKVVIAVCGLIIIVLTGATLKRNAVWQSGFTIWEDVIEKSPGKARGYNNLGYYYFKNGEFDKAVALFNKTLELAPSYYQAHKNLGSVYLELGQFQKAVDSFTRCIAIDPRYADVYNDRGNGYRGLKEFGRAIDDFSQAIALNPADADYYFNRGLTLANIKEYDRAIVDFSRAVALNPGHSGAFLQRGMATYIGRRDFDAAGKDLRKACDLGNGIACGILTSGLAPGKEP